MNLTIVTPCLNRAETIARAVESVLAQGVQSVEHIVVDGGSTDGTLDILARYTHLRVVSEPDRNLYDAVNKGLALAKGDIVGLLNGDDAYLPGCFEAVMRAFALNPSADMVTGGASIVEVTPGGSERTVVVHNSVLLKKIRVRSIISGIGLVNARFMRRDVARREHGFDVRFPVLADKDFLMRIFLRKPTNIVLPDVIYAYQRHPASLTMSGGDIRRKISDEELRLVRLRLAECKPGSDAFARYRLWHAWAVGYAILLYLQNGELSRALALGSRHLRTDIFWPIRFVGYAFVHWLERPLRMGLP